MAFGVQARRQMPWWGPVAFTLGAGLLVGLAMAFLDRPFATFAHDVLKRPLWAVWVPKLAHLPPPLAVLGLVAGGVVWFGQRRLTPAWRTVMLACGATIIATICVILLKVACGRMWPETWVDNNPSYIQNHVFGFVPFHKGAGFESFPSGHMTRITAPFAVLWVRVPRWRVAWVAVPLLVMAGLLVSDFHWISDCIAGIWLGSACAWVVLAALEGAEARARF